MSRPTPRPDVALMSGYHSPQVQVDVRLNTNEAPVPPPVEFTDRLAQAMSTVDWHRYPDRSAEALRERIGQVEGAATEQVFVANGSNEVLQTLMLAYGGPGRCVLTFEPTYALHSHIARVCGTAVRESVRRDDFTLDLSAACDEVLATRPAITFLCSPNNPTGRVEPPETVEALLAAVESVDGLLVVDEAYGQFAPWSALQLVDESRSLVVTRTFSKTWSMAAARLGYLIGPTWCVEELDKVVLPYHLDSVKQAAGLIALDFTDDMVARVDELVVQRDVVAAGFDELGVEYWPSGANFILFRVPGRRGNDVWNALLEQSILVRNCSSWPRLTDCLRVTLGTAAENRRFLEALSDIVRSGAPEVESSRQPSGAS